METVGHLPLHILTGPFSLGVITITWCYYEQCEQNVDTATLLRHREHVKE